MRMHAPTRLKRLHLLVATFSFFATVTAFGENYETMSVASAKKRPASPWIWPESIDLSPLRDHDRRSNPLGDNFQYAQEVAKLDYQKLRTDLIQVLQNSQDWWPADFGNYGPLFIRLSWHSAGTYRTLDGRGGAEGGQIRFAPLESWPDNGNLDKARRLLWPLKKKYGASLSWSDLLVLAGTIGMEQMGFETYGFAFGRADDWEPDRVYWGPEAEMLASRRQAPDGTLQTPLAATQMGLIYVNPEGPSGEPDPEGAAAAIRTTFGRMAMNDEETVALIAGGHTFGKMHGARKSQCIGEEPGAAPIEQQGLGWYNRCGKGHSEDTFTSGLEGAWTQTPIRWSMFYLSNLLHFEWQQSRSPAGAVIWVPTDKSLHRLVPDAHRSDTFHPPVMTTADLALKFDPAYRKIAERFLSDPESFRLAFAKAWFKLTHRDMGPPSRYVGGQFPKEAHLWQDPIPPAPRRELPLAEQAELKKMLVNSGLTVPQLVRIAWGAASSFRASDMRGGANGGRIALAPQKDWSVNDPRELRKVLQQLRKIRKKFGEENISLADLIVFAGGVAIEQAAAAAGIRTKIPFTPGRGDATQSQTDIDSFRLLEPTADAFRNFYDDERAYRSPVEMLIDRADQLRLTVPEMTVLLGGLRVLQANTQGVQHGVFTDRPGVLTHDFFVNLLDMETRWQKSKIPGVYEGVERKTNKIRYTATSVDLVFGANSELRAVAEAYAYDDAQTRFVQDFIRAWTKVMMLDRFDM